MFYRSSPAPAGPTGLNMVSSPLADGSNDLAMTDGDRTPRGQIGGE